jgi:hypothetical protein
MPVCASAVPELDTCVASVANPANAYAVATVETSLTQTYEVASKFPIAGQVPRVAMSPEAEFVPELVVPPSA